MKYAALVILIFSLPCFAVEYNVGLAGAVGLGISRWEGEFYNFEGVYIGDRLDSEEPIYQAGLALSAWITETLGMQSGLQYGWYNFQYSHTSATTSVDYAGWKVNNLLIPVHLMYGIPLGKNRMVIGAGISICRQLSATSSGPEHYVEVPDSLLETTVGPQVSIGYEMRAGGVSIFPSFSYVYGIGGLSDQLVYSTGSISNHYFMLCLGLLYRL
ncbi:MAG: outer membrane beta-barrel protein [candidate division WOR-3 bacterium]|nr:MAG: outer membrane beta-barrel protein [candidate division WOR-3 bacterium]